MKNVIQAESLRVYNEGEHTKEKERRKENNFVFKVVELYNVGGYHLFYTSTIMIHQPQFPITITIQSDSILSVMPDLHPVPIQSDLLPTPPNLHPA